MSYKKKINPKYKHISTEKSYNMLLKSGMFWEFHPELTGDWQLDKYKIFNSAK